jgi:hypothetical protein
MSEGMNPERFEVLMVKVVDDVATPAEREELMAHLKDNPVLRAEYEAHLGISATTQHLIKRLEHDVIQDQHQQSPVTRFEEIVGVAAVLVGLAMMMVFGGLEFFRDPQVPTLLKVGAGLGAVGTGVLLFSVIRARLKVRAHDPYKEVIR